MYWKNAQFSAILKKYLLFVSLFCLILGQAVWSPISVGATETEDSPKQIKFLALGDSYTLGTNVEPVDSWPYQLTSELSKDNYSIGSPEVVAGTGWPSFQLLGEINSRNLSNNYELVSLLIGVNDQVWGRDKNEFRADFKVLLSMAINYSYGDPNRVIVLSIPDYSVSPIIADPDRKDLIRDRINEFNAIVEMETNETPAHFVNVTGISRLAEFDGSLLAYDDLHPSGLMYRYWVEELLPIVKTALDSPIFPNYCECSSPLPKDLEENPENEQFSISSFQGVFVFSSTTVGFLLIFLLKTQKKKIIS